MSGVHRAALPLLQACCLLGGRAFYGEARLSCRGVGDLNDPAQEAVVTVVASGWRVSSRLPTLRAVGRPACCPLEMKMAIARGLWGSAMAAGIALSSANA